MGTPSKHLLRQGAVLRSLAQIMTRAALGKKGSGVADVPGPVLRDVVPPRDPGLIRDYVRNTGGSPSWYKGLVPPHLYPQWSFPLMSRTLVDLPYQMTRIINAGCKLEIHAPIPADEPLLLEAQLTHLDDNGKRALVKNHLTCGTDSSPNALEATVTAFFPLKRSDEERARDKSPRAKKEKPHIPADARRVDRWRLSSRAGLDFALLTGDFNPVHWVPQLARMSGFKGTILHGYASMARLIESLNRQLFAGDPTRLSSIDVRFSAPILLPGKVGVFTHGEDQCFVGKAPGAPACLTATYTYRR